ncbi:unannotated protein [freshwater metagenome]|uniref:Unannotated protein n=1 Tax=freshwater metagenome TaxID=449393 RepID=A0A6J7XS10_9ZZZZ|nr:YraN family protein [Actinomycetota bacterium]
MPTVKKNNKVLGAFGEEVIVKELISKNFEIIERNWRIREGEIDIIALSPDGFFSFVEVKTRSSLAFGHPFEAITPVKAQRLQRLALAWLATHKCLGCDYRIDIAAVLIDSSGGFSTEYRVGVL